MKVPKLKHTDLRGIGWHVSYRDRTTGQPRKQRFGMVPKAQAESQYRVWLAGHVNGSVPAPEGRPVEGERRTPTMPPLVQADGVAGDSLLMVATSLLKWEESRVRDRGGPRTEGTIDPLVFQDRSKHVHGFLAYLNSAHGQGAVGRMTLTHLSMTDVEGYNRKLVDSGYSASQVQKRMQMVKRLIDRAGRPEHGLQTLRWNWESRDTVHGKPAKDRQMPALDDLKAVLKACDLREQTMVWMALGLGFGQRDLAAVQVGCIDADTYDMRRGKTGVDRWGDTPPLVWSLISAYLTERPTEKGDLMFRTRRGSPLVDKRNDAVFQWWNKLRHDLEMDDRLGGFYSLRHLGATEYGSRSGCSIGDMKRWLGHSASSNMADVYMKPVSPEDRKVVEWVRMRLKSKAQ